MKKVQEAVTPVNEVCNGLDDDCDGFIDENLEIINGTELGICQKEIKQCVNGEYLLSQESDNYRIVNMIPHAKSPLFMIKAWK